ncbi:mucoid phenotype synthesis protein RmpD [Klebsiella pneumoniae]|uniref:mucoid phenotype synthesis protein RmpD n=1 Tax=Klebsiella pneumoniae TaxID=573 RepID=UPI00106937C8|nr:mucoid phenotype synthesis protein RmpD [Klebsiella pneumoniae]
MKDVSCQVFRKKGEEGVKTLFHLFIVLFLFYISVYYFYSYVSDRRRIKKIFRSHRTLINRRKKSNLIKYITFNK